MNKDSQYIQLISSNSCSKLKGLVGKILDFNKITNGDLLEKLYVMTDNDDPNALNDNKKDISLRKIYPFY